MNENNAQEAFRKEEEQPLLFALDIGTRSVIGVLGVEENGLLRVLDVAVQEHAKRAMIDGQIEDIAQVAAVARSVREELEARQGVSLRRVCVAAAGRALKTVRAVGEAEYEAQHIVTARDVYELEMKAVDKARRMLLQENEQSGETVVFYCVGHAVVHYDLDGYTFSTVKGHKADKAKVEIIATFLPSAVVESLYTAMEVAGLQVESVTLEPIAAMNAVIPAELRLLNLALVDVGAGTSDIAISESGSVSAYTMATTAGDEISEELIRTCLVDFETAERIKQAVGDPENAQITYDNILGMSDSLAREEVLARLRPAVEQLARTICEKLKEANGGKTPTAVFLVGGGGKTPFLCELVAQGLGLDAGKVALGGNNLFKRIAVSSKEIAGPEYATPLGIALTALGDETRESFFIKVNSKPVLAIYSKEMTALDVLLMAGYSYTDLMGRSGKGLVYQLDGQACRERGERFIPASLRINEKLAAVSDRVNRGDEIVIESAVSGMDAKLTIGQLTERMADSFVVTVNGERCPLVRTLLKNGILAQPAQEIEQDDVLSFVPPTLFDICSLWGIEPQGWELFLNGEPVGAASQVQNGDSITWREATNEVPAAVRMQKNVAENDGKAPKDTQLPHMPMEERTAESGDLQAHAEQLELEILAQPTSQKAAVLKHEQPEQETVALAFEDGVVPVTARNRHTQPAEVRGAAAQENEKKTIGLAQPVDAPQQEDEERRFDVAQVPMEDALAQHKHAKFFLQTEEQEVAAPVQATTAEIPAVRHFSTQGSSVQTTVLQDVVPKLEENFATEQKQEQKQAPDRGNMVTGGLRITLNGDVVVLPHKDAPYQFLDLLPLAELDFKKPEGDVLLLHNGGEASYLDLIVNGDDAVIGWKPRES